MIGEYPSASQCSLRDCRPSEQGYRYSVVRGGALPRRSAGGVGKLLLAMPIALKSLDKQVATDRTGDATHHVLPGIVAVLQVGREPDGRARCKTDPWLRERAGDRGSEPSCVCPRARIVLHSMCG
jgi:hypothetical protein